MIKQLFTFGFIGIFGTYGLGLMGVLPYDASKASIAVDALRVMERHNTHISEAQTKEQTETAAETKAKPTGGRFTDRVSGHETAHDESSAKRYRLKALRG